MIGLALFGSFLGLVLCLGATGRLVYVGFARLGGRAWKRSGILLAIGVVVMTVSGWYLLHLFGPCNDNLTC